MEKKNSNKDLTKKEQKIEKKKKKKNLSKFALLRCLESYFGNEDHDQALALTEYIWKNKDKY